MSNNEKPSQSSQVQSTNVPKAVINKLIFYTAAMICAPLMTFFILSKIFNVGNFWSGLNSALMANVVLIGYVITAFTEDLSTEQKEKKNQ